ncbi:MAG: 50S ribosomal protein L5 [Candidatus Caenarcaniphilales bacterium]|nr:50S ribosomal protein L5 [Candidatus Caenarcaniphilales bacterium]
MNRKLKQYREEIVPTLTKEHGYKSALAVPVLEKIVLSRGINADESKTGNVLDEMVDDLARISGQKPIIRKATKSIATFKIREGMPNGIMVTLRDARMYAFLDRFISIASPRIRDFQGFKVKGDGRGNITVGIKDQRIFLETENRSSKGLQITFVTSATTDKEARSLLEALGFPFAKTSASA